MTDQHPLTGTAGALQALARTRKENKKAMERLAEPDVDLILALAAIIREVDGNHSLGAAALAEAILKHPLISVQIAGAMEAVAGFKKQHDEQMISILYNAFNQQEDN